MPVRRIEWERPGTGSRRCSVPFPERQRRTWPRVPAFDLSLLSRYSARSGGAQASTIWRGWRSAPGSRWRRVNSLAAGRYVERPAEADGSRNRGCLGAELSALLAGTYQRLLRLAPPADPPRAEDRERASDLWARLEPLPEDERLAVVRVAREFQNWALLERVCQESLAEASREARRAASLARLAQEIAARVRGPEETSPRSG